MFNNIRELRKIKLLKEIHSAMRGNTRVIIIVIITVSMMTQVQVIFKIYLGNILSFQTFLIKSKFSL